MGDLTIKGCSREGCQVLETGICLVDVEFPKDCNNILNNDSSYKNKTEEYRAVEVGNVLSFETIATILSDRKMPVVSIAGKAYSGKTTFIAVLFQRFMRQYRGFGGYQFVDSESFVALNQKYHYATAGSKTKAVGMPRSSTHEDDYGYHFKTMGPDENFHESIWLDLPGELFDQRLSVNVEHWSMIPTLKRTTHTILFVDLEELNKPKKRDLYVNRCIDALSHSVQSNVWKGRKLLVVFSKADWYSEPARDFIDKTKKTITRRVGKDFSSIDYCELHSLGEEKNIQHSLLEVWRWVHEDKPVIMGPLTREDVNE